MTKNISEDKILLGNTEYKYKRNKKGEKTLIRNTKMNNKEVKIVIKDTNQNSSKEIEDYIISVLSDLYIQRQIEKFS